MPSALLPDADEVVEVFTGDSLEEAMAYAVASLGPDLTVRRARKVRKGVQGLRGKETYEVAAVPAARVASSEDALEDAFAALLEDAEAREEVQQPAPAPRVRRTVRPVVAEEPVRRELPPAVEHPVAPPAPRSAPRLESLRPLAATAVVAPEPEPVPVRPRRAAKPRAAAPRAAKPRTPKKEAPQTASPAQSEPAGLPAWSREALRGLGMPRRVLDALPARDPRDDLAWLAALSKAIGTVVPAPAAVSEEHPVVVDGHGVAGVVGIVKAGLCGMTPGTITDHGRTAPATATELTLVVRAALTR